MRPSALLRYLLYAATVAALLAPSGACGKKSPTAPEQPIVTTVNLMPGTDFLAVGETADFTLQVAWSDGKTETMAGTWTSDNSDVATVADGHVVAVKSGQVTISAECSHGRATRTIHVVPEYRGSWTGTYRIHACSQTGMFADEKACNMFPTGDTMPLGARLNRTREVVSGTVMLGVLSGDASGQISMAGDLTVAGTVKYEEQGVTVNIAVSDWTTHADGDRMTGRFVQVWTVVNASGSMRLDCTGVALSRTSATLALPPLSVFTPSGRSGIISRVAQLIRTSR